MLTVSAASATPFSFTAVTPVLAALGLTAAERDPVLARSLRLLHPLDTELAQAVRGGSASLTDAATADEQIRFFQHQRARRSYITIADHLVQRHGHIAVRITDADQIDEASREFYDVAARISGWSVVLEPATDSSALRAQPDAAQSRLLGLLAARIDPDDVDEIATRAFDFVNVGDAWTAIRISRRLQDVANVPKVWNLLALAHAMLDQTIEAEYYYGRWADAGGALDRIRAGYGTAMLAIRHHPAGLRDLDRGADILEAAYAEVTALDAETRGGDSVVFDEVFNRNGYALVCFRRGDVDTAVRLLRWGIDTLTETSEKVSIHRSVLIYNLAQCYKQINDLPRAIATYDELLAVDPYMPEYHLESAKCHAKSGDIERAIAECDAALELDATLAAAWSLRGVYLGDAGRHEEAARAHATAYRLDPASIGHDTDAAYALVLADRVDEARDRLRAVPAGTLAEAAASRRIALWAETELRRGEPAAATAAIDAGLMLFPDSASLRANADALLSLQG